MKKPSIKNLSIFFISLALTAISWKSHKTFNQSFNETAETSIGNITLSASDLFDQYASEIYIKTNLGESQLDFAVFKNALVGYHNFKSSKLISKTHQVITIVDFNRPSSKKRLWIVDVANNKLLFHTLVAHGRGSGDNIPQNFSNIENSHQSSLGFYITSDIYYGKHGLSMKLDGMDKGFNSNAKERAIVIHGADYVSQNFINSQGRLGRSHGCPALPVEMTKDIIDQIKGKTTLFINASQKNYNSKYSDLNLAVNDFMNTNTSLNASL